MTNESSIPPRPVVQAPRTQPMQHGHRPAASAQVPATLVPETGWHFLHLFYRVDRDRLRGFTEERAGGRPAGAGRGPGSEESAGGRAASGLRRPGAQGRLRRDAGRAGPEGGSRGPDGHPELDPGPGAGAGVLVLLDHRGLRVRSRRRGVRPDPPGARAGGPGEQHLQGQGGGLCRAARSR